MVDENTANEPQEDSGVETTTAPDAPAQPEGQADAPQAPTPAAGEEIPGQVDAVEKNRLETPEVSTTAETPAE